MTTNAQTLDDAIDDFQRAYVQQAARIAVLENENASLQWENDSYAARLAAIRHHLKNIADVAGYPADGWARRALEL